MQRLTHGVRCNANRPRPVLIDGEPESRCWFQPIVVHVEHLWMCGGDFPDLVGDAANLVSIRPLHAELDGPSYRRPKKKPFHLGANVREFISENCTSTLNNPVPRLLVFRHDQELREILVL